MRNGSLPLLLTLLVLTGCQTAPRRAAPPELIGTAAPDGFPASVRLVTTDLQTFRRLAPGFNLGLRHAANAEPVDILALSGGGSGGAFGAGVLVGMTRTRTRPQFEMVTGVSAGALLAPFAFLGSDWDGRMREAFTGELSARLLRSPSRTLLARLLSPRARPHHNPLFRLVDHFVTAQMMAAVADQTSRGRQLIVATTDLDKHETVLWNLGAIARRGGPAARQLFRDVLIASASVPGVFPPVLIHVHEGNRAYDEMHVDGGVTTPIFSMPLIAGIQLDAMPALRGAHLYVLVNGQLARMVHTTPFRTVDILSNAFSAELTYKTRQAIVQQIAAAQRLGMQLSLASIPADYPQTNFIDFNQASIRALFDFANRCAASGSLWLTPPQSVLRNFSAHAADATMSPTCPVPPLTAVQ